MFRLFCWVFVVQRCERVFLLFCLVFAVLLCERVCSGCFVLLGICWVLCFCVSVCVPVVLLVFVVQLCERVCSCCFVGYLLCFCVSVCVPFVLLGICCAFERARVFRLFV